MDDSKDVALSESLSDYLRTSLEAYQKIHGYEGLKSGAMRAMLGCLLKRLDVGAPSKGIGTGQKMRYRRPCGSSLACMAGRNAEAGLQYED